ncbi:unnamed protein product [Protopolystoma xenopodis]|uniref:Actin-related protein 5 n=1 Tax=Protopolystoma xenopodis TaxID=117903 RepID=A0A448X0Q3_9PLAT|nr:unnamed protein product [Protopolystoma xenopodis]
MLREIKETCCYTRPLDCSEGRDQDEQKWRRLAKVWGELRLPDDLFVEATEALFTPSLLGLGQTKGLAEALESAVRLSGAVAGPGRGAAARMASRLVLAGGNTMFAGLADRLTSELLPRKRPRRRYVYLPPDEEIPPQPIEVVAPPRRNRLAWIGGSLVADLATFPGVCLTRQLVDEKGVELAIREKAARATPLPPAAR